MRHLDPPQLRLNGLIVYLLAGAALLIVIFVSAHGFAGEPTFAKPEVRKPEAPKAVAPSPKQTSQGKAPVVTPVIGEKGAVSSPPPVDAVPTGTGHTASSDQPMIEKSPLDPAGEKTGVVDITERKHSARPLAKGELAKQAKRQETTPTPQSGDVRTKTSDPKAPKAPPQVKRTSGTDALKGSGAPPDPHGVVVSPY